jgi:hypothetical protein
MLVELELIDLEGRSEAMSVNIVEDQAADFRAGFLGIGTPLAGAILGQPAGKTLAYQSGDLRAVKIKSIRVSTVEPEGNAAAQRDVVIKKAVADSDRTNAVLFASSFSGKWGDYDPQGMENWEANQVEDLDANISEKPGDA